MDQTVRVILSGLLTILPFVICWAASRGRPSRYVPLAVVVIVVLAPAFALWNVRANTDSRDRDVLFNSLAGGVVWLSIAAAVVAWLGSLLGARPRRPAAPD